MPDITITVSAALAARLQVLLAEYNTRTGQSLSVQQWIKEDLRQRAIRQQFITETNAIREQSAAALSTAIAAKQAELLGGV